MVRHQSVNTSNFSETADGIVTKLSENYILCVATQVCSHLKKSGSKETNWGSKWAQV